MGKKREIELLEKVVGMQEAEIQRLKKEDHLEKPWFRGMNQPAMLNVIGDMSWAKAPAETVQRMLCEYYEGKLSIYDFWGIGDEREIAFGGEIEETVQFVLTDKQIYHLPTCNVKCAFTVDQKNALANTDHYMNSTNTNKGGWKECDMRKWLDAVYTKALPKEYEGMFKDFVVEEDIVDRFSLRSEMELFGKVIYGEDHGGQQIEWYKQTRNRIKLDGSDSAASRWYWERSPYSGVSGYFCCVDSGGSASSYYASTAGGIAPFGCI